jgi:CspA family cold shock protein
LTGRAIPFKSRAATRLPAASRDSHPARISASGRPSDAIPQNRRYAARTMSVPGVRYCTTKGKMMAVGTVKFFNTQKGYGFIQPEDGSGDVFVHISAVERAGLRSLTEGQKVSYDVLTERGRPAAGNLAVV